MLGTGSGQPGRVRAVALTGAAITIALAAGCGTVPAPQPGTTPNVAGHASHASPEAGSAQKARRLAEELLARLVAPAGAHPIAWHPPPALQQTQIALGVTHQADVHKLWLVPEPMPALAGFIQAHPPAGLPFNGFSQLVSGGRIASETTAFFARSLPPGIRQAQLVLEIAPAGKDVSMLRADGEVIWYPPRSAAEDLASTRWRAVTVTANFLDPAPHIARLTFTAPAVIAALVRFLDTLPATPGGFMSCPNTSVTYTLAFTPPGAARPSLLAGTSACGIVQVTVDGHAQPALDDRNGLILRAAQAALAGHPGSLAPAPGPTTPVPAPTTSLPLPAGP